MRAYRGKTDSAFDRFGARPGSAAPNIAGYRVQEADKGKQEVRRRTSCGCEVRVRVRYFTRKASRQGKKRYPGLLVLGIHERYTPGLASEISRLAGMLGSLEEARPVLFERGIDLNVKTVPRIAYRFAERARTAQPAMELDFGP